MQTPLKLPLNVWVPATWQDYLRVQNDPDYQPTKLYYLEGQVRVEMNAAVGPDHARDNAVIPLAVNLFCLLKGMALNGLINCSFNQPGVQGCQPDIAYYLGENAANAPSGSTVVNLEAKPAPDLAVEIADTSILDDLGKKRLLYESLAVAEYWVVDVQQAQILAFAIAARGSRRITESGVLPGLAIGLLEDALRRSRTVDQTAVGQWLMQQFR